MLFDRQRLLLTLLDALTEPVGHTDFQKLLFLYTKEWETEPSYEFVPYKFGGFSFTSYADKRRLIERGLLEADDQQWVLTDAGRTAARLERARAPRAARFSERYDGLRGNKLIADIYRRFPFYATRSEIANKVLTNIDDRARVEAARPAVQAPGLLTIGYEGKSLERYLNQLLQNSVTLLCDVRRNPLSRKYGFSKSTLGHACAGVGIRYEHLPELGIASAERKGLVTQADYEQLFSFYESESLPMQTAALAKIRHWIETERYRVALTCFEELPCQCHRHCVADALAQLGGAAMEPIHL
jgi:hypothetical protein